MKETKKEKQYKIENCKERKNQTTKLINKERS